MKIKVIGRRYSDVDTRKAYPNFEKIDEQTWEIEADTLRDAKNWLVENHPDMYMGANIICENGDFSMMAVPCGEYGRGNYETQAARIAFVKENEWRW